MNHSVVFAIWRQCVILIKSSISLLLAGSNTRKHSTLQCLLKHSLYSIPYCKFQTFFGYFVFEVFHSWKLKSVLNRKNNNSPVSLLLEEDDNQSFVNKTLICIPLNIYYIRQTHIVNIRSKIRTVSYRAARLYAPCRSRRIYVRARTNPQSAQLRWPPGQLRCI